jgi:hypothetical protein
LDSSNFIWIQNIIVRELLFPISEGCGSQKALRWFPCALVVVKMEPLDEINCLSVKLGLCEDTFDLVFRLVFGLRRKAIAVRHVGNEQAR